MKKILQLLLCTLIYLSVQSCSTNNEYLNPEQFYSLKDTLKGEMLSTPIESKNGSIRLYYTEYGLLACTRSDSNIFQLLDSTNATRIMATGKRGRGPNEFLTTMGMQYDYETNQFSVFDMYRQELVTYLVSSDSISLIKSINLKRDVQSVKYINDSLLVFIDFYPHQKIGLINTKAEIIYEEEYNPLDDNRIKTTDRYHNAKLDISPNKKYTVAIDGNFPLVKVFINKPDTLELKWKKMLFEPKYNVNSQKNWYIQHDDNYLGFTSLYLTNEYIYLKCDDMQVLDFKTGAPTSKHTYILVMDYEGNIVNKYLLDKFFAPFTVSPNGKSLYAVIYDPDFLIAKYSL
ncbi:MAG: BF3164 family lipoprotein [Bacilli bacterium]